MPHLDLTQEELDRRHPSLIPPDDERLDDLTNDADDAVYLKGLKLAEGIRSETSQQGRTRNPLLALLKKQQQHQNEGSSSRYRASTIRPLGGGVLSGATAYRHTATDTNTTTTTTTTTNLATDGQPKTTEAGDADTDRDVLECQEQCGTIGKQRTTGERIVAFAQMSFPRCFELI